MPKATFVRKAVCLEDVLKGAEWIQQRFGPGRDSYYIAAEHHLSRTEWEDFTNNFFAYRVWIEEFVNQDHPQIEGAFTCIRVTGENSDIAILVDPQGYNYARYVAIESPA